MPRDSADALLPEDILAAYALGYFPMARTRESRDVVWVLPKLRGALPLDQATAPKKLLRLARKEPYEIRVNTAFAEVIEACAAPGPGREDTWINDQIIEAYNELHYLDRAHSVECWADGALVGGLYGIEIGGVFCGESMFSRADNASKIAMLHLIARLTIGGFQLLDAQFYTDHLAQFGVAEMADDAYQERLKTLAAAKADFFAIDDYSSATGASNASVTASVWQSITQTS